MYLKTIQKEIKDFETQEIQIVDGLFFNQKETIETIYFYDQSRFTSGNVDDEGDKKYFFNINRNPQKVTTKAIDFDTKNINIQTAAGGTSLKTWFFERDLKFWMKKQNFGKILNRIFAELPKFGSVVLKVIDGKPYFVDLRNFILEQASDTLGQSDFLVEKHNYVPAEFRKVGKEMGWDKIEEAIMLHREMDKPYITVYERYGELRQVDEKGNITYDYKRIFVADVGMDEINEATKQTEPYQGVILKEDKMDTHPYWEFHMEKIPGRWLGIGIVEVLFDAQVRQNELANQEAKSTYWASLRVFQTSDDSVNRNLKTEVQDGAVLNPEQPITQIDMTERNLAYFNLQTQKWLKQRDELTFSYDVIRGERLPSGTPLGSARLAAAMTGSHFDQIRENIALDVKEFLFKAIIPQFEKENSGEHILRIAGEDLDKVRNLIINQRATNALFRFLSQKRKLPTKKQFDTIKVTIGERVSQGKEKLLKIPNEFYKNVKYIIDIIITEEQKDTGLIAQTLFAGLQAITADPTILIDPSKKKFFYRALEMGGVSPIDIEPDMAQPSIKQLTQGMPLPKGAGGGVSKPAPAPAGMSAERRV